MTGNDGESSLESRCLFFEECLFEVRATELSIPARDGDLELETPGVWRKTPAK